MLYCYLRNLRSMIFSYSYYCYKYVSPNKAKSKDLVYNMARYSTDMNLSKTAGDSMDKKKALRVAVHGDAKNLAKLVTEKK